MTRVFRSRPKGVGNIGSYGDGVDADFIRAQGSRAQRRFLDRHQKRAAGKAKTKKQG